MLEVFCQGGGMPVPQRQTLKRGANLDTSRSRFMTPGLTSTDRMLALYVTRSEYCFESATARNIHPAAGRRGSG